jgi:histidine triad (HIT) family protein
MGETIFSKIIKGEIPATFVYQDDDVVAFKDINPAAPVHILIVPREFILNATEVTEANAHIIGKMFLAARKIAEEQGLAENGYRLVMNNGVDGGQSVFHMHLHLLGGRKLAWPPG